MPLPETGEKSPFRETGHLQYFYCTYCTELCLILHDVLCIGVLQRIFFI